MPSSTFWQILLNETSSPLQCTSRKIKPYVTVISQMRRTKFQQLEVLINHKMSYFVSLWYLCKLILCWIEMPINIQSLIKWWLRFDVIDGGWFFQHEISMTSVTSSIVFIGVCCMRKMKDHQKKNHMLIIFALLTTDVIFAYWPLLQFLLSPTAYLKDCVWNSVVSFALDPVLAIAIKIDRHCTKMSTKKMRNIRYC